MASKINKGEILAKIFDDGEYTALFADGAVSAACGYALIMIPSSTDRLFLFSSIAGRPVPCGLCLRLASANCLPP